jgi:hypothetical protein
VESFDVFLCHNSEDKSVVREISRNLGEKNIQAWLLEVLHSPLGGALAGHWFGEWIYR